MLAKTYPNPSEMVDAREAAKDLVAEVELRGERIEGLRGGLGRVVARSHRQNPVEIASIALLDDNKAAKVAREED